MRELEHVWSFEDVAIAHDVLDALEDAQARAEEKARREGGRR